MIQFDFRFQVHDLICFDILVVFAGMFLKVLKVQVIFTPQKEKITEFNKTMPAFSDAVL